MGLDNPVHIAFLLILLLLLFGAKRLPELGRSLGSGMRGFKESLTGENGQPTLTAQQPEPNTTTAHPPAEVQVAAPASEPRAPFAA
jgi:sec-independent protein translocase protein TatA